MVLVYLVAPVTLVLGMLYGHWIVVVTSVVTWLLMIRAYLPTVELYQISKAWALLLPAIAFLYTLMTVDSAIKYYRGRGGAWKGRTY